MLGLQGPLVGSRAAVETGRSRNKDKKHITSFFFYNWFIVALWLMKIEI